MNQLNYIIYSLLVAIVATLIIHSSDAGGRGWGSGGGGYGYGNSYGSGGWSSAGSFHK
jgi:hypothetical protein